MLRRFRNKRAIKKLEKKKSIQSILDVHQKKKKTPPLFKGAKIEGKKLSMKDKSTSSKLFQIKNNMKKMEKARKAGQLVLSIALMLSVFYLLFLSPVFMITEATVFQTLLVNDPEDETVQMLQRERLDNPQINNLLERYVGRNLILLNIESVENLLSNRIANLEDLNVRKLYPYQLEIEFKQFDKVANLVSLVGPGRIAKDNVIDENAKIAEVGNKNPAFPTIRIETDEPFEKGDQVMKIENLNYILQLIDYFEENFEMSVLDVTYLQKAREVHIYTDLRFNIWLDIQRDFKPQLGKLKNAMPRLNPYDQQFDYIDLRIENANGQKIFYKLK